MLYRFMLLLLVALVMGGCTTTKQSMPSRTATEQLLISGAADDAANKLQLDVPAGTRVWVDTSGFSGFDKHYAVEAVQAGLLEQGLQTVQKKEAADVIVDVRAGALSIDQRQTLFGTPSFEVPVPFASAPTIPEIPLFKKDQRQGVAKVAAFAYDADSGELIASSEPTYGFSHRTRWKVLLFVSWTTSDLIPKDKRLD